MITKLVQLRRDIKGVTAMEYGLLAGTTVVVGLAGIAILGTDLAAIFTAIGGTLTTAAT